MLLGRESQRIGILHSVLSIRYRGLFRCKLKRLECNAKHLRPSITKVKEERKFAFERQIRFIVGCICINKFMWAGREGYCLSDRHLFCAVTRFRASFAAQGPYANRQNLRRPQTNC